MLYVSLKLITKRVKLIAELLTRTKRTQSGAPWVRKFGNYPSEKIWL